MKMHRIELTAAEASALHDIARDNWPDNEEDWQDFLHELRGLEHDGLVERDYDEGWQLSNEGLFAYHATAELQWNSPICIFFTQDELNRFIGLSEEKQASWFPYVA